MFLTLCQAPIVPVARQFVRHRTSSWNELSLRYSKASDEFYNPLPEEVKKQSKSNKQASGETIDIDSAIAFIQLMENQEKVAMENYEKSIENGIVQPFRLTGQGISREIARLVLPGNIYTQWVWKMNLRNSFNVMRLRFFILINYLREISGWLPTFKILRENMQVVIQLSV
jgi:thymidylate synthase (FAD)